MEAGDKIYFYANYDKLGSIQTTKISDEVVESCGEVTRVKNGLIFFNLENETGERKISAEQLNVFRDFGTSIYAVCDISFDKHIMLNKIIEVLETRISDSRETIMKLKNQYEGL